ncbi:MAG: response regulator [Elusimicrobia bacterium]|nr:response regulator [Elusimicrobiota bacterium]
MNERVLIIDDDELVRNYVSRALSGRGFTLETAVNGSSAVALMEKEKFDVIICDLKMPDIQGDEVIKRARVLQPGIPVIVISGSMSESSKAVINEMKVEGALLKPFGIDEIRSLVDEVLKKTQ